MKTNFLILGLLLSTNLIFTQVGININQPKSTLHIVPTSTAAGTAEGLIAPNLTRNQIINKSSSYGSDQKGAIVYITGFISGAESVLPATIKEANIINEGYYYFDGVLWKRFTYNAEQIYLPSFNLPLPAISPSTLTYDLYNDVYKKQFTKIGNPTFVSSNSALTQIPDLFLANHLDYVVTYFDSTVINNVSVNSSGVLSYRVVSTNPLSSSFINIVLVVK